MKNPLRRSLLILGFIVVGVAFDATLLDSKLWTELRYRTMRSVADIEPGAKQIWHRLWMAE